MALSFKKLVETTQPCWACPQKGGAGDDILVCTMGRYVRNLPGRPFPGWSGAEDRAAVAEALLPVLETLPTFKSGFRAELPKLTRQQRLLLLERKQITPSMAARQGGCHILISKDQGTIAMVNEEEHLCIHTTVPGLDCAKVLKQLDRLDGLLNQRLTFAANTTDGYLTSMPAEAGDGVQLYAVLHLPAMLRTDMMERVRRGLEKLGLSITPFFSEAGEEAGSLYVIFTAAFAKGETQRETRRFTRICNLLADREEAMQKKTAGDPAVPDSIYRAYALLRYSWRMDFKELVNLLSLIRLGLKLNLLAPICEDKDGPVTHEGIMADAQELYVTAAPAHIRALHKEVEGKAAVQHFRSTIVSATMQRIEPREPLPESF